MGRSPSKKPAKPTEAGTFQPGSSPSDWLAALNAQEISESPGPEWLTREDVQKLINRKRFATQQYITQALKNGTIEVKKFHVPRSDGAKHATHHYRILK
jgi:hypothetical protein